MLSALAETNRSPFDLVESESELVAGPFIETSGVALFGQYFIAEMASMILFSGLTAIVFLGGWEPLPLSIRFVQLSLPVE